MMFFTLGFINRKNKKKLVGGSGSGI